MPIVLFLLTLLPGQAGLTGTWTLDRVRSDFGREVAPRLFVLQIEQTGKYLAATVLEADASGQRVSYRECRVEPQPGSGVSCLLPDGVDDETWQITARDELTITQFIKTKDRTSRHRLVLERSASQEY